MLCVCILMLERGKGTFQMGRYPLGVGHWMELGCDCMRTVGRFVAGKEYLLGLSISGSRLELRTKDYVQNQKFGSKSKRSYRF